MVAILLEEANCVIDEGVKSEGTHLSEVVSETSGKNDAYIWGSVADQGQVVVPEIFFKQLFWLIHDLSGHENVKLATFEGAKTEVISDDLDNRFQLADVFALVFHQYRCQSRCYGLWNLRILVICELDEHRQKFVCDDVQVK